MGQNQIADRLVGLLAQDLQPFARGRRRGPRFDGDDEILTLDGADIWVALGGQRIDAIAKYLECIGFFSRIGRRCEGFAHLSFSCAFQVECR